MIVKKVQVLSVLKIPSENIGSVIRISFHFIFLIDRLSGMLAARLIAIILLPIAGNAMAGIKRWNFPLHLQSFLLRGAWRW